MMGQIWLAIIAGLAAALTASGGAVQAATKITTCGHKINAPGSYLLTTDLNCPATDGIDIATSNVTLMLDGHSITGPNFANIGINIAASGRLSDINIQGKGLIQNFYYGIFLQNVDNSQIQRVISAFSGYAGIISQYNTNVLFSEDVVVQNDLFGLYLYSDSNDEIQQNQAVGNGYAGIIVETGSGNQVHNNGVYGNLNGIYVYYSNNNQVHDNTVLGNGGYPSGQEEGFGVAIGGVGNNVHDNTSQGNFSEDLYDFNFNCTEDSWHNDTFFTANPSCLK